VEEFLKQLGVLDDDASLDDLSDEERSEIIAEARKALPAEVRQHVEDHAYQQGKEAGQKESGGGASEDELDELRSERDDLKEKLEEAQQKVEKLKADAGGPEAYSTWAESSREVVAGTIHEKVYLRVGGAIEEAVEIENRARFQRVGDVHFAPEAAAQRYDIRQNESESGSRSRAEEALQDV